VEWLMQQKDFYTNAKYKYLLRYIKNNIKIWYNYTYERR
jgi:ATP-dependent DNA helicase RecG